MTELGDALRDYEAAAAQRNIDVRSYLLTGSDPGTVRSALTADGLAAPDALVEWFSYCGGVIPDSKTAGVFQGRLFLSIAEALAHRVAGADPEHGLHFDRLVPLMRDYPTYMVNVDTAELVEFDVELGYRPRADSLAAWIGDEIGLLPDVGPHPAAQQFNPISMTPGQVELSKRASYEVGVVISHLIDRPIAKMWIETAALNSKEGNQGLERDQAARLRRALVDAGVEAASDAIIFEGSQTPEGYHNLTIFFLET